jgi:hypothetical protein
MCYAMVAYDVGLTIDLVACEHHITAMTQRPHLRSKRRTPSSFEYHPAPLHVTQEGQALLLGNFQSLTHVEVVLFDFGAVSLTYPIPLHDTPLPQLLSLSELLYDNAAIQHDSRQRVEQLLMVVQDAVKQPRITDFVEDYAIFQIEAFTTDCKVETLCTQYAQDIAQLLRAERTTLSAQEVHDATANHVAFGVDDVTLVDWHAALLFDREAEDVRAVLEFANVELLELRYLDEKLDEALEQAYDALARRAGRRLRLPGASAADLRHVAHLQVDSAILFEGINNTLKLLGDQYLARVYRLASQRFHLSEWDASILRKLSTLESIYQKISDRATNRRMEVLEWIIIILIAVSILLPFIPGMPAH